MIEKSKAAFPPKAGRPEKTASRTSSLSVLKLAKSECPNPQGSY